MRRLLPFFPVLAALALRLWGIGWGLPNAGRHFSYHPDESVVAGAAMGVNPLLLLLDTGFYNYGSLSMLLAGAAIHGGEWIGLVGPGPQPGIPSAGALLAARLVTALLGAGTCLFLFGAGRLLFCRAAGLLAAAFYALAPLAVQHGHFATVDVPATFFVAGCLHFSARALGEERRPRDLLWAGIWAGLAAATKYNTGLVLLAPLAAWAAGTRRPVQAGLTLVGALAGFLAGCPGCLLNPAAFRRGLLYEIDHVRQGHGDVFVGTPPGLIYHASFNLFWGLGLALLLLALAGILAALARRARADLLLAAYALPYYLLIGLAQVKFARYTLPLFPALLLWAGACLASLRRPVGLTLGGLGAAVALLYSIGFDQAMTGVDPRDAAAAYLRSAALASVGFPTGPWYYHPPLAPGIGQPIPPRAQEAAAEALSPRLIASVEDGKPVEWSVSLLQADPPEAVVLSEFEYADAQRIGKPAARAYLDAVQAGWKSRHDFTRPLAALGLPLTSLDTSRGLPTQKLPHDMLYSNPTIVVFTR